MFFKGFQNIEVIVTDKVYLFHDCHLGGTMDKSTKTKLSVCIRYLTDNFEVEEAFPGFFDRNHFRSSNRQCTTMGFWILVSGAVKGMMVPLQ